MDNILIVIISSLFAFVIASPWLDKYLKKQLDKEMKYRKHDLLG